MIDRIKKAAVYGAILAVAGVFALAAAFSALFGLLQVFLDEPWAAALSALAFAMLFYLLALTQKPRRSRHDDSDADGGHGLAALAGGLPSHIAELPGQIAGWAKRKPVLLYGAGALAAVVLIRRPGLIWLLGSNLLGMRVQKRRDRRRGLWTRT